MLTHKQKMARAKKTHRPWKTVEVALDFGLSEERDEILAEIVAAGLDEREGFDATAEPKAKLAELEARESESLVLVKVYRSDPARWANISANVGYNLNATCRAALMVDGRIVEAKSEISQTPEEWEQFFSLLAPSDYTKLTTAAYLLNEKEPADRVERLKKSSAATRDSAPN